MPRSVVLVFDGPRTIVRAAHGTTTTTPASTMDSDDDYVETVHEEISVSNIDGKAAENLILSESSFLDNRGGEFVVGGLAATALTSM